MTDLSRVLGAYAEPHDLPSDVRDKLDRHLKSAVAETWGDQSLDRFIIGLRDHYPRARIWLLIEAGQARELWRIEGGNLDVFDPEDAAQTKIVGELLAPAPG